MEDYKPNSNRFKEEQKLTKETDKKVKKVIKGSAKTKKKSELRKLTDVFISDDISNVKSYIFMDVLIPSIKKAIDDIVSNGIHMLLYNGDRRGERSSAASKVTYSRFYNERNERRDYSRSSSRSGIDYDDVLFDRQSDAEAVLSTMEDVIEQFGVVSVGDLYDLAEISTTNYAINKYGWTDLRSAKVVRVPDGFMIKLPRALPLD